MQKRTVLNSPRLLELKKRRQRTILNKTLISSLGLLTVFISLAYLSHLNSLNISDIEILGNKVVDTEIIKATVREQITGKYLWVFPKTNILFYPKNNIENELQNKFKRIKNISLSIKNNKVLLVSLDERVPKYTWCGTTPDLGIKLSGIDQSSTEKCYFLDEDGYVFDEAPYFSGEVYFKFYGLTQVITTEANLLKKANQNVDSPTSEINNPSGSYFSKQNFKQLISFKDILLGIGLKPVMLYATADGDIQIFLSSKTPDKIGPKIIFKADSNFQNVAENLEAALTTEPLQSKFKNKYSSLEYIDLRFGNKVYDKFSTSSG